MSIKVTCEGCNKSFSAKEQLAGKRVRCPGCKQPLQVPLPPNRAEPEASGPNQVLSPWLVAGAAGLLFFIASVFALVNYSKAQSLRENLAAAEQKVQEATTATEDLTKRLALAKQKGQEAVASQEELKKKLAAAERKGQEAGTALQEMQQRFSPTTHKPSEIQQPPPPLNQQKRDKEPPDLQDLLIGKWKDIQVTTNLREGKRWGDMEFSKDGRLTITVKNTKTNEPAFITGTYKVIDNNHVEITIKGVNSNFIDTPRWTTIDMAVALLENKPYTMKVPVSISNTTQITFAKVSYEKYD